MSIVTKKVPVEVVVLEKEQTEYICDGCEERYLIGHSNQPKAIDSLHPPHAWWEIRPADGLNMYAERRVRHACSTECLRNVADLVGAEVGPTG